QENRPRTHRARRQRGVDDRLAVHRCRLSPRALECIHLAVENRAPLLQPPIVTAPDNAAAVYKHRADGNAALGEAERRFFDRGFEKLIHTRLPAPFLASRHASCTYVEWRYRIMLHMALVFLVIGLISALLGFTTIAGASFAIAKFLAALFLVLFLIFLIVGLSAARRIVACLSIPRA